MDKSFIYSLSDSLIEVSKYSSSSNKHIHILNLHCNSIFNYTYISNLEGNSIMKAYTVNLKYDLYWGILGVPQRGLYVFLMHISPHVSCYLAPKIERLYRGTQYESAICELWDLLSWKVLEI